MDLPTCVYGSPRSGLNRTSSEQPIIPLSDLKNRVEQVAGCHEEVNDKIQKALKSLTLRDDCYLIQFWAPCSDGKYKLLKTVDQPFVFGIANEGLRSYRRESERNWFLVDEKYEEDLIPVARAFRRELPEWTSDVMNYYSKNYALQGCAIRLNLHGYLVLPVFDSLTMLCIGVLELIMSVKHPDCAYEVQEIHQSLKAVHLTSAQAFNCPTSCVNNKNREHDLVEIFRIIKDVCATYKLPLAQTWTLSPQSIFVAVANKIETACSSFNSSCIGKVCMSATALPFHVHDLRFWSFREASREHHLLKSQGVVGRAMSSRGSSFCADVTELKEEEYPLVHNARMTGLRSCFAIYLNTREHDQSYILEFFLPVDMKEDAELQNMMQKIKMHVNFSSFECGDQLGTEVTGKPMENEWLTSPKSLKENMVASEFKLGGKSIIQVVRPPADLYVHEEPYFIQTSSNEMGDNFSCSEQSVTSRLKEDMVTSGFKLGDKSVIQVVGPPTDLYVHKEPNFIQTLSNEMGDNFSYSMDSSCSEQRVTFITGTVCTKFTDDVEKSNVLKEDRKRKRDLDIGSPCTQKVTVKATFDEIEEVRFCEFQFCVPPELSNKSHEVASNLKDEVAKRFELMGSMIKLKYCDEDNDLILICFDEDVKSALCASKSNDTISLIVKRRYDG